MILNIIMEHCKTHTIPNDIIVLQDPVEPSIQELEETLAYLTSQNIKPEFGDLIEFEQYSGYRNDGIAIFDGEKIIDLAHEPDDYGTLPQIFRVFEKYPNGKIFNQFYWHNVFEDNYGRWKGITHNNIIWFDHCRYAAQIIKNIRYDNLLYDGKFSVYTDFINDDGENIKIVLLYQDTLDNMTINGWNKFMEGYRLHMFSSHKFEVKCHYSHPTLPKYIDQYKTNNLVPLFDNETYQLESNIVDNMKTEMSKIFATDKLLAFECMDVGGYYPSKKTDKILYLKLSN